MHNNKPRRFIMMVLRQDAYYMHDYIHEMIEIDNQEIDFDAIYLITKETEQNTETK